MTATTRRSDNVRAKRNRRNQKQQTSRKTTKRSSRINRSMPPTVARNKNMARQPQTHGKAQVARKRYLALTQAGAEVRLPALPQLQIGWRFISAILAISMLWIIYTVWNAPNFRIKQTEIIGLERIDNIDVDQFLALRNQSIFSIDPSKIVERLENNFTSLTEINVSLGLPNQVIIELKEREPAVLWTQSGITVWIDSQGMAFEAIEDNMDIVRVEAFQAPTLNQGTEDGQEQLLSKEMVAAILSIADQAPKDTAIVFDSEHGLGWVDPRGWRVYFGPNPSDMELRLSMYQSTIDHLLGKGILPAMISLEYIHQPFYRLQP